MSVTVTSRARSLDELWQLRDVLQDNGPGVGLPLRLLEGLRVLLRCDNIAFNYLDSDRQMHHFMQAADADESDEILSPPTGSPEETIFWSHYWQSDCSLPERTEDLSAVRLSSDTYSRRQWHEHAMYNELLSDVEFDMMTVWGRGSPARTLRLLCSREQGPDFDDHDRFLLELLRPHIFEAFERAEAVRNEEAGIGLGALTTRQREVLTLASQGRTNLAIGHALGIAEGTVRTHLMNVYTTLGVSSRAAAAALLVAGSSAAVPSWPSPTFD